MHDFQGGFGPRGRAKKRIFFQSVVVLKVIARPVTDFFARLFSDVNCHDSQHLKPLPTSSRWRLHVQHGEWSSVFYRYSDQTAPERLLGASKFDQASKVAYPVTMKNIGFKPFAGKFSS